MSYLGVAYQSDSITIPMCVVFRFFPTMPGAVHHAPVRGGLRGVRTQEDSHLRYLPMGHFTREKTILMIAHRLKTVRNADQIFVIDRGRIVQRGTHQELMDQDGIYRRSVDSRNQAIGWKL